MGSWWPDSTARLTLGTTGPFFWRRPLRIPLTETRSHVHVAGLSGFGKSRFLAGLFLELIRAGQAVSLIDPHGDLARLVLAHLVDSGTLDDAAARERILYLDIPTAARWGLYLPFNVLAGPLDVHTRVRNVLEAVRRAWPSLDDGAAPTFENVLLAGVSVLAHHEGLGLPLLHDLLTDKPWREHLLEGVADEQVVRFFHERYDRWKGQQALMIESTLRRVFLLAFSPALRYSLGQPDNLFDFKHIMAEGKSLIINLGLEDGDARKLLGSLLTVGAEQAALSRAAVPAGERGAPHYLMLDEFAEFSARSGENLARILSLTRKFGLSLVLAHQTTSQLSESVRGALANAELKVAFRLGRYDGEYLAPVLGEVDPLAVKHELEEPGQRGRLHPLFYSLGEQWEGWVGDITSLPPQEALIRRGSGKVVRMRARSVPDPVVDAGKLAEIENHYLARYFRTQEEIEAEMSERRKTASPRATRTRALGGRD